MVSFPFNIVNSLLHSLFACMIFKENSNVIIILCSSIGKITSILLVSFNIFSLSFFFGSLIVTCLSVDFLLLSQAWCSLDSWICGLMFVNTFEQFSAIITANISAIPFSTMVKNLPAKA